MNLPILIRLPKTFTPQRVMEDPKSLRERIIDYFSMLTEDPDVPKHPTPPGLAMAMGLRGFDALMNIVQRAEADPEEYPEESLDVLHVAKSYIEDYYISNGLREAIPAQFTKFLLSAFFNRSEKTIQETLNKGDNQMSINILGIGTPFPVYSNPNALNSPLSASQRNDLTLNNTSLLTDQNESLEVTYQPYPANHLYDELDEL